MATLHMETERVKQAARQLNEWAADLLSHANTLRSSGTKLSLAWQSVRAESYQRNLDALIKTYHAQIEQLYALTARLAREVEEWEEADSNGIAAWNQSMPALPNRSPQTPASKGQTNEKFSWFKPIEGLTKQGLEILKRIPYDSVLRGSWKGMGRWLNAALGDAKAGWVGRMDRLGHIIKNPAVTEGLPFGLGVASDLLQGDRWDRALGSEAIEMAAEAALPMAVGGIIGGIIGGVAGTAAGGVGAIPGAVAGAAAGAKIGIAVYGVYQSVLAAGSIFSGVLQAGQAADQALWLQNTIEQWDIGERISDGLYDGIYHFATGRQP